MKISFIVWSTDISGGTKIIFELSKLLASRGHKVLLICLGSKRHKWYSDIFENRNIKLYYVEPNIYIPFIGNVSTYGLLDKCRRALKIPYELDRIRYLAERIPAGYDIYISTYFPSAIALYLSTVKGKKVYFVQDTPELAFENEGYFGLKMFNLSLQLPFDAFICNSSYTKETVSKMNKNALIYVGGVGVDINIFKPRSRSKRDHRRNRFYVMTMLYSQKLKGSEIAIKAINAIAQKLPIYAILVGRKPSKIRVRVECPYTYYRNVPPVMLAKLYQLSDVFIFTSYVESFGLPPLEAMACGCPVVTTDCKGNRDYAINYYNAIVVPPGDPHSVAEATLQVLQDDALRERLVEGGLKTAQEWSWDKKYPTLEKFLNNLINI